MKVIVAPEAYEPQQDDVLCFLAGGITACPNWQANVIGSFMRYDAQFPGELDNLVLFNPRRENFPIDDPNAAYEQISWEFAWLQKMDLFTMYFTSGTSDQPICMYELGRNICKMMERFPDDYSSRIIISYDQEYNRAQDVKIQTELAFKSNGSAKPILIDKADPLTHMYYIIHQYNAVKHLKGNNNEN